MPFVKDFVSDLPDFAIDKVLSYLAPKEMTQLFTLNKSFYYDANLKTAAIVEAPQQLLSKNPYLKWINPELFEDNHPEKNSNPMAFLKTLHDIGEREDAKWNKTAEEMEKNIAEAQADLKDVVFINQDFFSAAQNRLSVLKTLRAQLPEIRVGNLKGVLEMPQCLPKRRGLFLALTYGYEGETLLSDCQTAVISEDSLIEIQHLVCMGAVKLEHEAVVKKTLNNIKFELGEMGKKNILTVALQYQQYSMFALCLSIMGTEISANILGDLLVTGIEEKKSEAISLVLFENRRPERAGNPGNRISNEDLWLSFSLAIDNYEIQAITTILNDPLLSTLIHKGPLESWLHWAIYDSQPEIFRVVLQSTPAKLQLTNKDLKSLQGLNSAMQDCEQKTEIRDMLQSAIADRRAENPLSKSKWRRCCGR